MARFRTGFAVVILAFAIAASPASARSKDTERIQLYAAYRDLLALYQAKQYSDFAARAPVLLAKLDAVSSPLISRKLATIRNFHTKLIEGYSPRVIPKQRWLDPPVQNGSTFRRMSELI